MHAQLLLEIFWSYGRDSQYHFVRANNNTGEKVDVRNSILIARMLISPEPTQMQ